MKQPRFINVYTKHECLSDLSHNQLLRERDYWKGMFEHMHDHLIEAVDATNNGGDAVLSIGPHRVRITKYVKEEPNVV